MKIFRSARSQESLIARVITIGAFVLMASIFSSVEDSRAFSSDNPASREKLSAETTLPEAVRPVFANYLEIQAALAQDSLNGVAQAGAAMAAAVRSDPGKTFKLRLALQGDRLAKATSLTEARDAFQRASPHLIDYVKRQHLAGFYQGYCRMQKMAWLQADPAIANPYMGKSMPRCAWFRELNQPRG